MATVSCPAVPPPLNDTVLVPGMMGRRTTTPFASVTAVGPPATDTETPERAVPDVGTLAWLRVLTAGLARTMSVVSPKVTGVGLTSSSPHATAKTHITHMIEQPSPRRRRAEYITCS